MKRCILLPAIALVALTALTAAAAPAPTDGRAKERLEALKKRLPGVVAAWAKERWYRSNKVEVRVVRRLGPAEAKVSILSRSFHSDGTRTRHDDAVLTIHLRYYDGAWTTTHFDGTWSATNDFNSRAARFLMLAIDESEGK
jgi:hypothetical protein